MHVTHVIPSLSRSTGGLFTSISGLARSSMEEAIRTEVFAPTANETKEDLLAWEPVPTRSFTAIGPKTLRYSPRLISTLYESNPDLVHSHGLWDFASFVAFLWSRRVTKPYIISIHGMLEPWSLERSRIRKCVARRLYQDRVIKKAACLVATSEMEAQNIRRAGFDQPIAIIPNGVDLPPRPAQSRRHRDSSQRTALFLSRLHPKKGLLNLIEAWRQLQPQDWQLVIVGPDDHGYGREAKAAVFKAKLSQVVDFRGPAWGQDRFDHYWSADLFVLPSFSENFGLAVGEALACEVPVITTRGLPWQDLVKYDCGWWIEIGVDPLVRALREAVALSDGARAEMGARGRRLVAEKYDWQSAGRRLKKVYDWVLGRSDRPEFVIVD